MAATPLSSVLPSSASSSSCSLPFRGGPISYSFHRFPPFLLSPRSKPSSSINLSSLSLSLHLLSPVGRLERATASDDASIEDEIETELELLESETDQLLEQEHEQEEDFEEEEGERKISASSEDGRLYVGNLPYSVTSSQVAEIFSEAGAVRSAEIIYDRLTDRSRGFAFVKMESVEDAEKAIRMFDSSQIGGRTVRVNFPEVPMGDERKVMEPKIRSSYQSFVDTPDKIYAGNLSWDLTSQGLRDAFSGQPGFLSAKVVFERDTGRSRGFGFVSFSSAEEARAAIMAMNGVEVDGRALKLNNASERARSSGLPAVELKSTDRNEVFSGVSS